jgi:hypothetical protein
MTWHNDHASKSGVMSHPSDGESWKNFVRAHPFLASEPRNVSLGLCADGFAPFGQSRKTNSCWPIIITPYNLPPSMWMKTPYMFLTGIIPVLGKLPRTTNSEEIKCKKNKSTHKNFYVETLLN